LLLAGVSNPQIGVNFAWAEFDGDYAKQIDRADSSYAAGIDDYARSHTGLSETAFASWKATIEKSRLVTYDAAGNIYTGGGIPSGLDFVSFDAYVSTALFDHSASWAPSWFYRRLGLPECRPFDGLDLPQLRAHLSFFRDGSVTQDAGDRDRDRQFLDDLYECRMTGILHLLETQLALLPSGHRPRVMLVSEASMNGLLEFDAAGDAEPQQPTLLVEARVADEVERARKFYDEHQTELSGGVAFFLFASEFDKSINLMVGGASTMPGVLARIYAMASSPP
jgi:hypothetical protein